MSTPLQIHARLAPAEELFFTWLGRVFAGATLVGCAWLDDAPPLSLAAFIVAAYVALRVASQFGAFMEAAPFTNRALSVLFAVFSLAILGLSFLSIAVFVERLALSVAG